MIFVWLNYDDFSVRSNVGEDERSMQRVLRDSGIS